MLLFHWQGAARNFGDELNTLIWPRLLPDFFDDNPATLFLGIGSILDARHSPAAMKVVAGAGYGGYERLPTLDANWAIHWVRGPRTAARLGLPEGTGLGDPAMLLCHAGWQQASGGDTIGFMPHFESASRGYWREAADAAGIQLIDPREEPSAIIAMIRQCRLLLSEALHGAIVADALRVPWVALRPLVPIHRIKWHDWADTVGLRVAFQDLAATSLFECLHASDAATSRTGRRLLAAAEPALRRAGRDWFVARAARALRHAAAAPPQLSAATALDRCQSQMLARLDVLARDCGTGSRN